MSFLTTGNRSESGYSLNPAMYEALSISEPNLNSGVVKAVRIVTYSNCLYHPAIQIRFRYGECEEIADLNSGMVFSLNHR